MENFTPLDFQAKNFTLSISTNFNNFSDKNTKNERKWRSLHHWQKFYTAAGSDGIDKSHLCPHQGNVCKNKIKQDWQFEKIYI